MPLVRLEVKNEYGLGKPELYREASKEDPKAILDGVAVSGLVGILRQLGDLAEFAADVFHDLQEQVMSTASRSHKLMVRVQHIEAALPPLEKAVLAQTSHIHFAYTAGTEWHPHIRNETNHFIYNDLPRFIMDSYEEGRDPPLLHQLDKFDTGGPGSCLRRYSDPTFFRRLSGESTEANTGKVQRDKKARKSKKRRSLPRNRDISQGASVSSYSESKRKFTSPVNAWASPSQTASTVDMSLKSDMGDHSNSFDSRIGSGYIECVFHASSPLQSEEQESREFSSRLKQHDDTIHFVFPDEPTRVANDNYPHSSSPEQIAPNSSCVTWDEKAEVMEPQGQYYNGDESLEIYPTNSDLDVMDTCTANHGNDVRMDIQFDIDNTLKSFSSSNELDEVESEPDTFLDALNTIESESENDMDCQTIQEVKQCSFSSFSEGRNAVMNNASTDKLDLCPSENESLSEPDINSKEHESLGELDINRKESPSEHGSFSSPEITLKEHLSEHGSFIEPDITSKEHPIQYEPLSAPDITSKEHIPCESPCLVSLEKLDYERTPQVCEDSSDLHSSPGFEFSTITNVLQNSKVESIDDDPSSSNSRISSLEEPPGSKIISNSFELGQSHAKPFSVPSLKLWTNGGLLGLEPSKPPDFSSNSASGDSMIGSKDETISSLNCTSLPNGFGQMGRPGIMDKDLQITRKVSDSKFSKSCDVDQENGIPVRKTSLAFPVVDSDSKLEKYIGSQHSDRHSQCDATRVAEPMTGMAVDPDVLATSNEASQEIDENPAGMLGLGHRLLLNGFRRKVSLVHDGKPDVVCHQKAGIFDQRSGHNNGVHQMTPDTTFKQQSGRKSQVDLVTSSPPLEHMKISFHPVDGFETSKLKLKFPDTSHCSESIRDMFPSFQLVPEPTTVVHDIGSDTDDDTFCRSSPCLSDGCRSYYSESNSEQWESGEMLQSKDHELYDALGRISSVESVSSSLQLWEIADSGNHFGGEEVKSLYTENGAKPSFSGPSLAIASMGSMSPILQQETMNNPDSINLKESKCLGESTPLPPPLPPAQWWVLKPQSDVKEENSHTLSEADEHSFDQKPSGSTHSQQPKVAPVTEKQIIEEAISFKSKILDQGKFRQKEANQGVHDKGIDEKEDFLEQIRTKSFNLRRTVPARPTTTSVPTANVKVTAILEKANAIRQAVGSDDGDDDTWSDT
ncbi:protein SCAR1-like isoform X2 [Tripterygium wilfordii]|uniref:protein SCAR1-like isoform X2 n=1 Tax=Tripterygium wilfordii TaxID=458696 RepID=UPI0018F7F2EA|nr:protein SCAR1-like isoform X2 [Tripterygium wilfordii]